MSVVKPRTRVLYFRVSQEEFEQYSQACEAAGARSISDLARLAMQRMLGGNTQQVDLMVHQLRNFDLMLEQLMVMVERIDYSIRSQKDSEAGG